MELYGQVGWETETKIKKEKRAMTSAVLIQIQQQSQTHITSEVFLMQSKMMSLIFGPSSSSSYDIYSKEKYSSCRMGENYDLTGESDMKD